MFGLSCVKENYSEVNSSKISHTTGLLGHTHGLNQVLSGLQLKISLLQWVKFCQLLFVCDYRRIHLVHLSMQVTITPWSAALAVAMEIAAGAQAGSRSERRDASELRKQWALLPETWSILGKSRGERKRSEAGTELWMEGTMQLDFLFLFCFFAALVAQ